MWNHSSNPNAKCSALNDGASHASSTSKNSDANYIEKVEKGLDLTNYLKFVQFLFNKSTSDSESEDEVERKDHDEQLKIHSQSPSPTEIKNQNKFLSSVAADSTNSSSSNSEISTGPSQSSKSAAELTLPHSLADYVNDTSDSSSSTSSSSFSADDDGAGSLIPSDLTPMSDLELNNLLKKSSYPLGSDVDPMSFDLDDTTTDSDKKKQNKKKKKKSKKKKDDGNNQRQNKPNSGGNGNGSRGGFSGFGGESGGPGMDSPGSSNSTGFDSSSNFQSGGGSASKFCKNRIRKQTLKMLRDDEATASSSSGEISLKDLKIDMLDSVSDDMANAVSSDISSNSIGIGFSGFLRESAVDKCSTTANIGQVSNNMRLNCSSTVGRSEIPIHENNDDDNDSLSDYMSMAATAAASTAQVPPLPQHACNSSDSFFKFNESVGNGPSSSNNVIASIKSSTIPVEKSHMRLHTKGKEQRKRKIEGMDEKLESLKRKKSSGQKAKIIEMMNIKRRKIYIYICKKEIPKTQRLRTSVHKEVLTTKRRLAQACTRFLRQKAMQSQKVMKESVWRAKRLTREMQAYWKQADRVERDIRRRREKEAEEQRKLDVELMEAKRQQRKLNFLITQTELYAHFVSKKLTGNTVVEEDESKILTQLNEERNDRLAKIDNYDGDEMKNKAKENVQNAFKVQRAQVQYFDIDLTPRDNFQSEIEEHQQPALFDGVLKHYQLKGMNWLINLYDQGINGILADEMGLGKTVQSIAFLAHIAERYNVWGPFLVIAPASTLHNWQQELNRFVRDFKVVPYWGNPQERKILRQFWQQNNLHTPEASFHVVVTSYQIVMADLKYFNKIKWQYLILDEAQAIKSAASARWKTLLGFSCRNRLLLTGTPIQNTMGELWALLHFIMPSLFDSHDEFNDWFSKDVESHAENKTMMDEKHLSRLHLILKPFMLRRIKKDVENELLGKIEKLVPCSLTTRQRYLYSALKKKIKFDDLLKFSGPTNSNFTQHATTNLMNLVMQFRKVCNHPDLFERREVRSPFHMKKAIDVLPKLIFRDGILAHSVPSKLHIVENKLSVFNPIHTHDSLFHPEKYKGTQRRFSSRFKCEDLNVGTSRCTPNSTYCEWSFLRFMGLSSGDMWKLYCDGHLERLKHLVNLREQFYKLHHDRVWGRNRNKKSCSFAASDPFLLYPDWPLSFPNITTSSALKLLVFTSTTDTFYTWGDHKIISIPETLEHRILRSKKLIPDVEDPPLLPELRHTEREPKIRTVQSTCVPTFLYNICPKAASEGRQPYFYDRSAAWWLDKHQLCSFSQAYNLVMYGLPIKPSPSTFLKNCVGGFNAITKIHGWSRIVAPDKEKLVTDSGKLKVLDRLLKRLKANDHKVLIYSQMTKMIDLLEEFMWYRKWKYIRLDGSSKIAERRDMVADFQSRSDIFVFLLSTRAGGLGINLTAADTVIFYDSDWNPTVDQQAMDRAHRLGQTKQVTVYRLICKGTIEERILQRAKEKNELQRMVISGSTRADALKPKDVLSLLLDEDELEKNYRQKSIIGKVGTDEKHLDVKVFPRQSQKYSTKGVGSSSEILEVVGSYSRSSSENTGLESKTQAISPGDESKPSLLKYNQRTDEGSFGGSIEGSLPTSPDLSEEMEVDMGDMEYQDESAFEESLIDINPSSSSYFEEYPQTIDWNDVSVSDYDEDLSFIPKKPKMGRGTGKRGRPPSRVRVQMRELDSGQLPIRRGPGRPRLRPIGPANQGIRGRRPGRPPLSKKAETISSSLTPITPSQRVFGIYSSPI